MTIYSFVRPIIALTFVLAFVSPRCAQAQTPDREYRLVKLNSDNADLDRISKTIKAVSTEPFEAGAYRGKNRQEIKYRMLRPIGDKNRRYPLVVVLHGSGAIGTDNKKHLGVFAKMWALPEIRQKYPAYILAPQFPTRSSNYEMDNARGVRTSVAQPCLMSLLELVDSLSRSPGIDASRIYLVGYSMGASTTINSLSIRPDLFAAAVSISGIPQFNKVDALREIPIWMVHGNTDTVNAIASDLQLYKELGDNGHTTFWEFDKAGHEDIFTTSVIGEYLPQWLFGKVRAARK